MKSLIVLRGTSGQGKSSTLNLLRLRLEENPAYKIIKSEQHPNGYDWTSILDGPFGKVGIITFGDPGAEDHVEAILCEMLSADATIIFAASRTRGGVWDILQEFALTNDFNLIVTSPLRSQSTNRESLPEVLNSCQTSMFKGLIEKLSKI